jgi:hypothetical protein
VPFKLSARQARLRKDPGLFVFPRECFGAALLFAL